MASVKQAWIKKYGEIEGLRLWEERKKKSAITEQNLIEKYGEIEGKSRWNSYKNKLKIRGTLDWYIQKYGKVDGTGKYNLKNKKLSVSYGALKLNGFSDFEINEIRNKHANKSVRSIDNFISESGDEMKGVIKYNNYISKKTLNSSFGLEYWIKKCDGDISLAKNKLSEHQSRNINWWKNKYGEIDGVIKYNNWLVKTTNAIMTGDNVSKGQISLENDIKEIYNGKILGYCEKYGIILTNIEKKIFNIKNSILYPDIILPDLKIIINYHGDFWHGSETIFNNENTIIPRINKSVKDVRLNDVEKDRLYVSRGYNVITIWEKDYKKNKENAIKKIKNEIYKKNN
jgi:hypothetical protein